MIKIELVIHAYNWQPAHDRLCDKQPVKWVAMMKW